MEFPTYQPSPWNYLLTSPSIFSYPIIPENYVHWTQNPESHIFSADLPGKALYTLPPLLFSAFILLPYFSSDLCFLVFVL